MWEEWNAVFSETVVQTLSAIRTYCIHWTKCWSAHFTNYTITMNSPKAILSLLLWFRLAAESHISNSKQQKWWNCSFKMWETNVINMIRLSLFSPLARIREYLKHRKEKSWISPLSILNSNDKWRVSCFSDFAPEKKTPLIFLEISTVSYTMFRFVKTAIKSQTFDINASHTFL